MAYADKQKGRYTGKFIGEYLGPPVMGKRTRVRERFGSLEEAERWEGIYKLTGERPSRDLKPSQTTFGEMAKACEASKGPKRRWGNGRDPAILQRLRDVIPVVGADTPVRAIDNAFIEKLITDLSKLPGRKGPRTAATVNRYLTAVRAVLSHAHRMGKIAQVPVFPRLPEADRLEFFLTEEAERAVCAHLTDQWLLAAAFCVRALVATGLRWSEFESLEPTQVEDPLPGQPVGWVRLWKTKTDTPRSVPVPPQLAKELRAFAAAKGFPNHRTFHDQLANALEFTGQNAARPVHMLRHTCASRLAIKGYPLQNIQRWLGHKNIETTMRYAHLNDEVLVGMVENSSPVDGANEAQVVKLSDYTAA